MRNIENKENIIEFAEILNEIVIWWENWNNSENPTEIENPPIEKAKELLLKHGFQFS